MQTTCDIAGARLLVLKIFVKFAWVTFNGGTKHRWVG